MNWPYIAGFFDGEGCISFKYARRGYFPLAVTLHQSGPVGLATLQEIADFLAAFGIEAWTAKDKKGGFQKKEMYRLNVAQSNCPQFLEKVFPYLRIKKVLAQDVLRFRRMFPKSEKVRCQLIREAQTNAWKNGRVHADTLPNTRASDT